MPRRPLPLPLTVLVPKAYPLLVRCVEDGAKFGWNRAHKHTERPTEEALRDAIVDAVMSEIGEWFDFPEGVTETK